MNTKLEPNDWYMINGYISQILARRQLLADPLECFLNPKFSIGDTVRDFVLYRQLCKYSGKVVRSFKPKITEFKALEAIGQADLKMIEECIENNERLNNVFLTDFDGPFLKPDIEYRFNIIPEKKVVLEKALASLKLDSNPIMTRMDLLDMLGGINLRSYIYEDGWSKYRLLLKYWSVDFFTGESADHITSVKYMI